MENLIGSKILVETFFGSEKQGIAEFRKVHQKIRPYFEKQCLVSWENSIDNLKPDQNNKRDLAGHAEKIIQVLKRILL